MAALSIALTATTDTLAVGYTVVSAVSGVAIGTVASVSPNGYYSVEFNNPFLASMLYSGGAAGTLHTFVGD